MILENQKCNFGFSRIILYLSSMIARLLQPEILKLLKAFPAVCILGPRQVGKTTLAKTIAATFKKPALYLDLEKPFGSSASCRPFYIS